jgi:transcriptional regulator with XRE-family HTH domain
MRLSEKIRYLREVEGSLRGLGRAMTQQEIVRAIQESESDARRPGTGKAAARPAKTKTAAINTGGKGTISQSYLSQIESGARPHLTNTTRLLLARFFKVHPGYLVDDPEGYHAELMSDVRTLEDKLDLWLIGGAERFRRDAELCQALLTLSRHHDSRRCLLLLESILETPELVDRLLQVLRPEGVAARETEPVPQRLKPRTPPGSYGTVEAVPLSRTPGRSVAKKEMQ